jgi:hypothetical protein
VTLDGYVSPPRFDLLHADVEGMEVDVLRGAERLIMAHRPALYVEAFDDAARPSLVAYMRSLGYRLWHHDPPLYNPDNYAGNPMDLLRGIVSLNILGLPEGRTFTPDDHTREVA